MFKGFLYSICVCALFSFLSYEMAFFSLFFTFLGTINIEDSLDFMH